MDLRPHHILCIQKFTGHGYDEAFTAHMTAIVSALADKPDTPVTLTRGSDDLCRMCPNNEGGVCTTLEKVERMDSGVLTAVGAAYGESRPWSELARRGRERVFETDAFYGICAHCEWFGLCKSTEI